MDDDEEDNTDKWSVLRDHCDYVCSHLNANQTFLLKLFRFRLIDKYDCDSLLRLPDWDRNYRLVVHLLPKRPGHEIGVFFNALKKTNQRHIVKKLRPSTDRFMSSERRDYLGPVDAEDEKSKRNPVRIERTELEYDDSRNSRDFIGSGSYSEVFRVKLTGRDKEFAIKVVGESSVFTTEVDILEHMRGCPFIVQLFGICVDRHFNALVLEYASKGDLHCFLTRSMQTEAVGEEGQLARSWTFRRRVIFQIALGMQYLHSHNVMHRDLKSGNVYLDSRYDCKIGDFNRSRLSDDVFDDSDLSEHTSRSGSLWFKGPELSSAVDSSKTTDKKIDMKKYDCYGFGMIVYHVKELKLPDCGDESAQQVIEERIMDGWKPPVTVDDGCPPVLQCLLSRCCNVLPEHRPNFEEIVRVMMPLGPETSATDDSGLYGSSGDVDGDMSVVTSGTDPIPASDSGTDVESCVDSQDNNVAGFVGKLMFTWQSLQSEMDAQRIAQFITGMDPSTLISADIILSYILKQGPQAFQEFETALKVCQPSLYEKLQVPVPSAFIHYVRIPAYNPS